MSGPLYHGRRKVFQVVGELVPVSVQTGGYSLQVTKLLAQLCMDRSRAAGRHIEGGQRVGGCTVRACIWNG